MIAECLILRLANRYHDNYLTGVLTDTSPWASLTKWLHPLHLRFDKEKPDDTYRYEAIPTRAVAETVRAKNRFHRDVKRAGSVNKPRLIIQSEDGLVMETASVRKLFRQRVGQSASRAFTFYGDREDLAKVVAENDDHRFISLNYFGEKFQVSGLAHVAINQTPNIQRCGSKGLYRNCGVGGPRPRVDVRLCEQAQGLWLGSWNGSAPNGQAFGMWTFSPCFDTLTDHIEQFIKAVQPEQ